MVAFTAKTTAQTIIDRGSEFFVNRKALDVPHSLQNSVDWNDTKQVTEKWNGTKIIFEKWNDTDKYSQRVHLKTLPQKRTNTEGSQNKKYKSTKQQLDSIVSEGEKLILSYNSNGKLIESIEYYWDEDVSDWMIVKFKLKYDINGNITEYISYLWDNGDWSNACKEEYQYDGNGNKTKEIMYFWDGSEWIGDVKLENMYDGNGNLIKRIEYLWKDNDWIEAYKSEYKYDTNGNLIELINYDWDGNNCIKSRKYEYEYDSNGNLIERVVYEWDGNEWQRSWKSEYTFNVNGILTENINYVWDEDANDWRGYNKSEYTYDTNGNQTEIIEHAFVPWGWIIHYKYEYTYDTNGNQTGNAEYNWDGNDWIEATNYWKYKWTYDANGNLIEGTASLWDWDTNNWIEYQKSEFTYNLSYFQADLIYPCEDPFELVYKMNNMLIEYKSYQRDWDGTETQRTKVFYWSPREVSITETAHDTEIRLYPNPTTGQLKIENDKSTISSIEIFDIAGKLQKSKIGKYEMGITIDISYFSAGIYFVQITTESGKMVKKVIKE